jgi:hypothetical protein
MWKCLLQCLIEVLLLMNSHGSGNLRKASGQKLFFGGARRHTILFYR